MSKEEVCVTIAKGVETKHMRGILSFINLVTIITTETFPH